MDATEKEKIPQLMARIGAAAKAAARALALAPTEAKNKALTEAAQSLRRCKNEILSATAKDMAAGEDKGLSAPMLDRLALTDERLEGMATGLDKIANLDDPIGTVLEDRERPNGLRIQRVRVPLGVIGV
ncbi:MAG: gamma-glutamyl-phosphate reductase, partial [Rhodospirillales bacterium]|nr:gamma-glutamyl-phosphate reductase [Rhodospirillales bacterium]